MAKEISYEDFNFENLLERAEQVQDLNIGAPLPDIPFKVSEAREIIPSFFPDFSSIVPEFLQTSINSNVLKFSNNQRKKTDNVYIGSLISFTTDIENNQFVDSYFDNKKKQAAVKLIVGIFQNEYIFNINNLLENEENYTKFYVFFSEIYNELNLNENILLHKLPYLPRQFNSGNTTSKMPYAVILKISNENYDVLRNAIEQEYEKEDSKIASFLEGSVEDMAESLSGNPYLRICDYSTFRFKLKRIYNFMSSAGFLLKRPKKGFIVRGIDYYKTGKDLLDFIANLESRIQIAGFRTKNIKFNTQYDLYIYFEKDLSKIKFIYKKDNNRNSYKILGNIDSEIYKDLTEEKTQRAINQNFFIKNYEEVQSNVQIRMFGLQRKKQRKKIMEGLVRKHFLPPGTRIEALDCVSLSNVDGNIELLKEIFIQEFGSSQADRLLNEDIARSSSDVIKETNLLKQASELMNEAGESINTSSNDTLKDSLKDALKPNFRTAFGEQTTEIADTFKSIDPFSEFTAGDFTNVLQTAAITAANIGFAAAAAEAGGALDPEKYIKKGLKKVIKGEYLLKLLQSIPPGALFGLIVSLEIFEFTEEDIRKIAPDIIQERDGEGRGGVGSLIDDRLQEQQGDVQERAETRGPERFVAGVGRNRETRDDRRDDRREVRISEKRQAQEEEQIDEEEFNNWFERFSQRNERQNERREMREERQTESGGGIPYRVNQYRQARLEGREQAANQRTSQEKASIIGGLMQEDSTRNQMFNISEESLGRIGAELRELEAAGASGYDKAQYVLSIIISDFLTCDSDRQGELQDRIVDFVFDILGFDVIMEDFNDIAQFLNAWDARNIDFCDPPDVPFADFIYNFFIGNFNFKFGNIGDFLKKIFAALVAALIRLILGIIGAIINLILQAILQALSLLASIEPCDILNFLRDFSLTLQTRMCGELNGNKFGRALAESLGKESFARLCIKTLGLNTSPEDIKDLSCAACSLLTPNQYLDFLSGNPDRETINVVGNYIKTRNSIPPEQRNTFANCDEQEQQSIPEGSLREVLFGDDEIEDFVIELGAFQRDLLGEIGFDRDLGIDPSLFQNVFTFCEDKDQPKNRLAEQLKNGPLTDSAARELLESIKNEQESNIDKLFDLLNNENSLENMIQESLPPLLHPTNILMGSNKKVGVEEDDIPDYDASDLPIVPRDEEPYGQLVSDKFNNFFDLVGNVSKKSSENVSENIRKDYIGSGGNIGALLNSPILPISPLSIFSIFGSEPDKNFEKLKEKFENLEPNILSYYLESSGESSFGLYNLVGFEESKLLFDSNINDYPQTDSFITVPKINLENTKNIEYGVNFNFKFGKSIKQCRAYSLLSEEDSENVVATLQQIPQINNILTQNSSNIVYFKEKFKQSLGFENFTLEETNNIFLNITSKLISTTGVLKENQLADLGGEPYVVQLEKAYYRVGPHIVDFEEYSNQVSASYFNEEGDFSEEKTLERYKPESPNYIKEYIYTHDSDLALLDAAMEAYAMRSFIKTSGLLVNTILNINAPVILSDSKQSNIIKAFYVQNVLDELEKDNILDEYVVLSADLEKMKTGISSRNSALMSIEKYLNKFLELAYLPESKLALYRKKLDFIDASLEEIIEAEDFEDSESTLVSSLREAKEDLLNKIEDFSIEEAKAEGGYVEITDPEIFNFANSGFPVNVNSRPSFSNSNEIAGVNFEPALLQKAYYVKTELLNEFKLNTLNLNINIKFVVKEKNNQNIQLTNPTEDGSVPVILRSLSELQETSVSNDRFEISINDFKEFISFLSEEEINTVLENFNLTLTLSNQIIVDGESFLAQVPTWSSLSDGTFVLLDDASGSNFGSFRDLRNFRLGSQPSNLTSDIVANSKIFVEIERKEFQIDFEELKNKKFKLINNSASPYEVERNSLQGFQRYIFKNSFNIKEHTIFYDFIFNFENIIQFLTIYYAIKIKKAEDSLAQNSNFSQNRIFTNKYKNLGKVLKEIIQRIIE
jgi:hypothetical protein